MCRIEIVFKNIEPISINKLYAGKIRRFTTPEAKKFKLEFNRQMKRIKMDLKELKTLKDKKLKLEIIIESSSWLLKDGKSIRKKDCANYEKIITDSLFNGLNELLGKDLLDDSQVFCNSTKKLIGEEENIYCIITELTE